MTKRIETYRVTYDIVTPLFCGGAKPETPELRLPSFKGVLRWYWRAVAWQSLGGDLAAIQHEEAVMFGSPESGQGKVIMRQVTRAEPRVLPGGEVLTGSTGTVGPGARYLGYGVMAAFASQKKGIKEGQLKRGCLLPPLILSVELRCRGLADPERARLLLALRTVGLLGAMGSKSRKGYGSLVLRELAGESGAPWQPPRTIAELRDRIAELHRDAGSGAAIDGEPPYTALTPRSRHVVVAAQRSVDALTLLDFVGREIVRYRSWGKDGKILGRVPHEARFRADHDLHKAAARGQIPARHPQRAVFGLPHNYGGEGKRNEVTPERGDRRASPLLIHIHLCERTPVAVLSFLPAKFLPENTQIVAFETRVPVAAPVELWAPIHDLLDRFIGRAERGGKRKEPFGDAMEVRP